MEDHEFRLPTVAQYFAALRAVEPRITPKQREMLLVHHAAQAHAMSATRLAEAVGFASYRAVNLQYGLLADAIRDELGIDLGSHVRVGILVEFVHPGYAANEHFLWVMRPNVVQALEDLGWAPRAAHMLYPESALQAIPHASRSDDSPEQRSSGTGVVRSERL